MLLRPILMLDDVTERAEGRPYATAHRAPELGLPLSNSDDTPTFRGTRVATLRLWHWLNAAIVLGLLGTVLLRKTVLSWRTNAALIETSLGEAGITVTPELAREIAVSIRAPMWEFHYIFGFTLAALLVTRVLLRFRSGHPPVFGGARALLQSDGKPLHYRLVKAGYAVFYAAVAFMVLTGLSMYFKAELGIGKELAGTIKELHEPMAWFFAAYVSLHIIGVVVMEHRGEAGLISDMVSGGAELDR